MTRSGSISIENLSKSFGETDAVKSLTLDVAPGEFITLLGPSGCGKSTSLHMIAGLLSPSAGTIRIDGRDVTDVLPQDRDIAMVFQSYALYPHYTVFDNIAFPLRARRRRLEQEEIRKRVEYAAGVLSLEDLLHRYPSELSGGQRQRVALGRATVREPVAFLLDEPLSNLDHQLRVQTRSELKDLHSRLQATMLYVTHDQGEAMALSDRVVVMRNGNVEQIGTPLDLYRNPASRFVGSFVGEPGMNMIDGTIEESGTNQLVFRAKGIQIPLARSALGGSGDVTLGVRPENIRLTGDSDAEISGTVKSVELLGSRSLLRAEVANTILVTFVPPDFHSEPGDPVHLKVIDPTALRFFDRKTGVAHEPVAGS